MQVQCNRDSVVLFVCGCVQTVGLPGEGGKITIFHMLCSHDLFAGTMRVISEHDGRCTELRARLSVISCQFSRSVSLPQKIKFFLTKYSL